LSRGQQRRCGLARIVLANRPLWLLDEPAGPLDGEGRACLAALVATHRARGGLVIAATHQPLDWPDARSLEMGRL
ncbi:ABC transporter ATP-binding protein, partial [Maricaulis sp.]